MPPLLFRVSAVNKEALGRYGLCHGGYYTFFRASVVGSTLAMIAMKQQR
jgi:hypothetical protein